MDRLVSRVYEAPTGHSQVPVPPLVKLPEPVMKVDIGVSTEVAKVDVGVSTYRRTFTNVIGSRPSAPAAASASLSALASAFGSASASGSEPAPELSLVKECRKLPKVIRGLNELGHASDASQLVAWRLLLIPQEKLTNCLDNLADEQHIKTRIPKICDILAQVNQKYEEPAIQNTAAKLGITATEAKTLLTCPVRH